jgi:Transposase DDE domain
MRTDARTKRILGFRQFLLRGIRKVKAEWKIVTTVYNLKKMHKLGLAC